MAYIYPKRNSQDPFVRRIEWTLDNFKQKVPPMPDRKTLPPPPPTGAPTDADFAGNPLAC